MKRIVFVFLLLLGICQSCLAQMPHWTYVKIPIDSLTPNSLTFYDSLHGYLGATKLLSEDHAITSEIHAYYFETTDGGRTWKEKRDSSLVGSINDPIFKIGAAVNHFNSPVVFGDLKSRYILNLNAGGTGYQHCGIAHSNNAGASWSIPFVNKDSVFYPLHSFYPSNLLVYGKDDGFLYLTQNGGLSYFKFIDQVYKQTLYNTVKDPNFSGFGDTCDCWGNSLSFDNSDNTNWTVAICRGDYLQALHPPTNPMGLQTLVSDASGHSWKAFLTPVPEEDSLTRIGGTLQYIKGTPNLYYFTGQFGEGQWGVKWDMSLKKYIAAEYADPMCGINWMYSTDYGKSWEFQKSYGDKRRAFEAVSQNTVWITARQKNSILQYDPATDILLTTDNGLTWKKDSTTLTNDRLFDGRIMTFSDPKHGWIAATTGDPLGSDLYVFRYDATEQPLNSVEFTNSEIGQKFMKIYPNPSSDEVNLQLPINADIKKVEFYDLLGIQRFPIYHLESNIARIEVRDFLPGTYIARVSCIMDGWNGRFTLPLIVQH